jgi:hypothetical protein
LPDEKSARMTRSELVAELLATKMGFCRRIDALVGKLGTPSGAAPTPATVEPDPDAPRPFIGLPMESKYAGRCSVCGNGYAIGAPIVYARDLRKAAHLGCGQPGQRTAR